jgi:hypothetical protein
MAAPPTGPTPASAPGSLNGFPARSEKHYGVPAYAMSPTASTPVAAVCPRRAEQSRAQPLPFFFVQSTVWVSSSNLENIYVITADSKRGSINNLLPQLNTEHCSLQEFLKHKHIMNLKLYRLYVQLHITSPMCSMLAGTIIRAKSENSSPHR